MTIKTYTFNDNMVYYFYTDSWLVLIILINIQILLYIHYTTYICLVQLLTDELCITIILYRKLLLTVSMASMPLSIAWPMVDMKTVMVLKLQ